MNLNVSLIGLGVAIVGTFIPIYTQFVELNSNISGIQAELKHDDEKLQEIKTELNRLWDRYNSMVEKKLEEEKDYFRGKREVVVV